MVYEFLGNRLVTQGEADIDQSWVIVFSVFHGDTCSFRHFYGIFYGYLPEWETSCSLFVFRCYCFHFQILGDHLS